MPEQDTLRRAQAGDDAAVEELFGREWRPVYNLAYRTVQNRACSSSPRNSSRPASSSPTNRRFCMRGPPFVR